MPKLMITNNTMYNSMQFSNIILISSFYRVMPEEISTEIQVILSGDTTDYILCPVQAESSGIENTELVTGIIKVHVLQKKH